MNSWLKKSHKYWNLPKFDENLKINFTHVARTGIFKSANQINECVEAINTMRMKLIIHAKFKSIFNSTLIFVIKEKAQNLC